MGLRGGRAEVRYQRPPGLPPELRWKVKEKPGGGDSHALQVTGLVQGPAGVGSRVARLEPERSQRAACFDPGTTL